MITLIIGLLAGGFIGYAYNNVKTKGSKENIYDLRPNLGLPAWFKK